MPEETLVDSLVNAASKMLPTIAVSTVLSACVTTFLIGVFSNERETLMIDAKQVVKVFTQERGLSLTEEEMSVAILEFDALVMAEAQKIHDQTGAVIINSNHMLAGGRDVSVPFAHNVIAAWDATNEARVNTTSNGGGS